MPITHRPIPTLPDCPLARRIAVNLRRSYPVGRQEFSRGFASQQMEFSVSTDDQFPVGEQARLVTTINATKPGDRIETPYVMVDAKTFVSHVTPENPGLYSVRTRYSSDGGSTWLRDPVPDAWVLVDPPQVDGMRLYSMIPSISGSIADWANDLERIKAMGFNTVHLLPLTMLDASQSPYSAHDLFSIDPSYVANGVSCDSLCQLEKFVEKARELQIALCFDLVLNHVGSNSLMVRQAPDWIVPDQDSPDGFRRARFWSDKGWLSWDDLVLINYEHPSERIRSDIYSYMTEYALFWGKYADYTNGFVRFDNLHSSDRNFILSVTKALHAEYPRLGIIAEYFTDEGTLLNNVPTWGLNLVLATPWNYHFVPELREYLKYIHRISEHVRYFMPITSHDSGSPTQEFGSVESTIPRYVAAALMGTGATGITQGVEWGEKERFNFIGKHPKVATPEKMQFADFLRRVNLILSQHTAFRGGDNCHFVDNGHHAVIAAFRRAKHSAHIGFLVACNFDITGEQILEVDLSAFLPGAGPFPCQDLLTGVTTTHPNSHVNLLLPPCAAQVLMF